MEDLILRPATHSDYDNVVSLMQQLNPDDPVIDRSKGLVIFRSILEQDGLTIFIAEAGDQSVASCYLNVIPNLTRGGKSYAVIENVVTLDVCRRRGFGAALLKHVIATAFEQGCYKVMLLTGRDEQVHSYYEHCGMEKNSKTAFIIRN